MKDNFERQLETAAKELKERKIKREKEKSYKIQELSSTQIEGLAEKIEGLPQEEKIILMDRYLYKSGPKELEKTFGIKKAEEKLPYITRTLSILMEIEAENIIDDKSFEVACQKLLEKETKKIEAYQKTRTKIKYSKDHKRKLKNIGISLDEKWMTGLKRAAIFFLVVTSALGLFLTSNAEAREKLFDWIIQDFGKYSIFTPEKIRTDYIEKLSINDLKINYIPEGFKLVDVKEGRSIKIFQYKNKEKQFFYVKFNKITSEDMQTRLNTEEAILKKITLKGSNGKFWSKGNENYLIWQQNGIECFISGNISRKEIIKTAENISK